MEGSGCATISYSELKGKLLVKDYEVDGITCDDPGTFVKVERNGEKYKFSVSLNCKKDGKYVYETVPEVEGCSGGAGGNEENPAIDVTWTNPDPDPSTPNEGWSTDKNITIKISAPSGLIDNISIRYAWSMDPNNPPSEDKMYSYNYRNAYGTLEDTFTFYDDGKDETGNYRNGIWYLYVTGEDVIDVGGHVANNYRSGKIKFDNTAPDKPTLSNSRNNLWTGEAYVSANKYVIGVKSNDGHSGVGFYQYCYPEDNGCDEYSDWTTYANSAGNIFTTTPFIEQRDEDVYIRACDKANNCSDYSSNRIKIDTEYPTCSINRSGTYGINDWYVTNVDLLMSINDPGVSYAKSSIKYGLVNKNEIIYNNKTSVTQSDVKKITWYGFITDEAGNATTCNSGQFKVDTTKPTCRIISDASKIYFKSKADDTSGVDKSGINKSSTPSYSSDTQSFSLGKFYGHVTDKAGNIGVCTTTITETVSYEYVCGSYACGTYTCGSYQCNCSSKCVHHYRGYCAVGGWVTSCSTCYNYCTSYCPTYCTGKKCSNSDHTKINNSYCYS